jgi:hypothetical protein
MLFSERYSVSLPALLHDALRPEYDDEERDETGSIEEQIIEADDVEWTLIGEDC